MERFIATFMVLLLVAAPLQAGQPVDEVREARPDARIELAAVTGRYRIVGTDHAELGIAGTLGEDVEELIIDGDPGHWKIEIKAKNNRGRTRGSRSLSDLTVNVPRGGELEIVTVSGNIEMQDLNGSWVRATSISGDVELVNVLPTRLSVETVSGTQRMDAGGRSESRMKSVSGNIYAENLAGRIHLSTVSGNGELSAGEVEETDMETVSGRISARLQPLAQARIQLSSHSGELRLKLPEDVPLDFRANSFSGNISNDFGGEIEELRGPGRRLEVRQGAGTVRVEAKSFSGRIYLEAD